MCVSVCVRVPPGVLSMRALSLAQHASLSLMLLFLSPDDADGAFAAADDDNDADEQERAKDADRSMQRLEQRETMADKAEEVTKMTVTVFDCRQVKTRAQSDRDISINTRSMWWRNLVPRGGRSSIGDKHILVKKGEIEINSSAAKLTHEENGGNVKMGSKHGAGRNRRMDNKHVEQRMCKD